MGRPVGWEVLGLGGDPTPGDPGVVVGVARSWGGVADDAEAAERGVRSLVSDGAVLAWVGAAGDVFRGAVGEFPEQLRRCKESYRLGAGALVGWAGDLEVVQGVADRALVLGREAAADLVVAQEGLSKAQGRASSLDRVADGLLAQTQAPVHGVVVPSGDAVRLAHREAVAARAGVVAARSVVVDASERLAAARVMALDAASLRNERARVASGRVHEAAGVGIAPKSAWESFRDGAAKVWDITVVVAKVVVAVLGIVALIIGGPLAWVVFAAALLVLADTLAKYSRGEASGWDVLWALVACIPATKGITTLAKLSTAAKAGGLVGAGVHVAAAGKTAIIDMAMGLRQLPGDLGVALVIGRGSWHEARAGVGLLSLTVPAARVARSALGPQLLMMGTVTAEFRNPAGLAQAGLEAGREAVQTFGSIRTAQMVRNADGGYDVVFRYHRNWDEFRQANADSKAQAMTDAGIEMPDIATPRNPTNTRDFARTDPLADPSSPHAVGFKEGYSFDVDHLRDLQVGGLDARSNMWWLEARVNRSEGAQLAGLLRRTDVLEGATFNSFTFEHRGREISDVLSMTGHAARVGDAVALAVP